MNGGAPRGDYHQELVDLFAGLRATAGGHSMRAVAGKSGLSVSHLSKVLGGTSIPTGPVAATIAAALGGRIDKQRRARDLAELADESRRRSRMAVTPVVRPTSGDGAAVREWLERLAELQESRPSWVRALGGPPDIARPAALDYMPAKLLVLFGPPGAGKSSWARAHAAGLARTAIGQIDVGQQPVIPLLVRASDMVRRLSGNRTAASRDPRVTTIEECLAGTVFLDAGQHDTVSAHLLSLLRDGAGGFAVLIDGADEAGENGIRQHLLPLLDLWQRTPGSAVVVTSRDDPRYRSILEKYAGTSDKDRCAQQIRPLSYTDLNSLAVAWLGTTESQRWLNEVRANPMNRPQPGVYQHNNLVDMMASPLLASFALSVASRLGGDRGVLSVDSLYAEVIRSLLRVEWKDGQLLESESVFDRRLRDCAELAFRLLDSTDGASATARVVREMLRGMVPGSVDFDGELRAIDPVLGGITGPAARTVHWGHPSLQKWLAAQHLAEAMSSDLAIDFLRARWWHSGDWQEVTGILLRAGARSGGAAGRARPGLIR